MCFLCHLLLFSFFSCLFIFLVGSFSLSDGLCFLFLVIFFVCLFFVVCFFGHPFFSFFFSFLLFHVYPNFLHIFFVIFLSSLCYPLFSLFCSFVYFVYSFAYILSLSPFSSTLSSSSLSILASSSTSFSIHIFIIALHPFSEEVRSRNINGDEYEHPFRITSQRGFPCKDENKTAG